MKGEKLYKIIPKYPISVSRSCVCSILSGTNPHTTRSTTTTKLSTTLRPSVLSRLHSGLPHFHCFFQTKPTFELDLHMCGSSWMLKVNKLNVYSTRTKFVICVGLILITPSSNTQFTTLPF